MGRGMSTPTVSDLAPLRVAGYRRLLLGTVVSALGLFLHAVAAAWVMLEMTDSPFMVTLVTASAFLPRLISGIPAGAIADIVDRRTIIVAGNTINAVTGLLLAWLQMTGRMTPALLIALGVALGLGSSVVLPAYQAIVPDLLPRDLVASAMSLQSGFFNVARAIGPALGGVLVAAGYPEAAFALNGVSYLVVALAAMTLRGRFDADDPEPVRRAMATGLRYIRHTPVFLRVVLVTVLFALTASSVQPLLPNVARDALGLGADGYGILFACFGGGALVGALLHGRVRKALPYRTMIPLGMLLFSVAGVTFGLLRVPVLNGVAIALVGTSWTWTLATMNATVQLSSPRWVRGRAMGIYLLAFTGAYPIGALLAGAVAEVIGAAETVALACALTGLVAVAARRIDIPDVREIADPVLPDDWTGQPHPEVAVSGSPVVVVTEFTIDPDDLQPFLEAMRELRRHRHRTGAHRWVLFRDTDRPNVMIEVFEVPDWQEHLRQHARMDGEAVAAIRRVRRFARDGGASTRHLVGIDVIDPSGPPEWEQLLAVHRDLHRADGSIPLDEEARQ
jgi:MFS family permease/quinol monooxygenase YgiN